MAEKTGIEWAHATWNPWMGCKMVSAGCAKCYMFRDMRFYGRNPEVVVRSKTTFNNPIKWAKSKQVAPGSRIFTCSWSDWFIKDADEWRPDAWEIIKRTPQYVYMILTKRPERIKDHLPADWGHDYDNVWLGVTCEDQKAADKRIPILLDVYAKVHFLSVEPQLSHVDLREWTDNDIVSPIDWVITGGESDKDDPRPFDLDWAREIRDLCNKNGIAYFHKQHGGTKKVDGAWGGRVLDGQTWDQFPY